MRGEESKAVTFSTAKPEIPPHARRRESRSGCLPFIHGNTSACAEKSVQYPYSVSVNRKYLRMRGEEDSLLLSFSENGEIPPHARRRGRRFVLPLCGAGNTSACAEKRFPCAILLCGFGKYLRMRGEEYSWAHLNGLTEEIPPHARRRAAQVGGVKSVGGNTSACAEKSTSVVGRGSGCRKYLRMRGEESSSPGALFSAGRVFRPRG